MSTLKVDSLVEKTSGNGVHIAGHVIYYQEMVTSSSLMRTGNSPQPSLRFSKTAPLTHLYLTVVVVFANVLILTYPGVCQ